MEGEDPQKLNETLGGIASALNGRGHELGQALGDLDEFLATVDPESSGASGTTSPWHLMCSNAYADAAPDLITTADNVTRISQTVVDEQQNLDALLLSAIGLADIGNDVVGTNRQALTDVLCIYWCPPPT